MYQYFYYSYGRHAGRCVVQRWCHVIDFHKIQYVEVRTHRYKNPAHNTTMMKFGELSSSQFSHVVKRIKKDLYYEKVLEHLTLYNPVN